MDLPKILHVPTLFWYIIQIRDILLTSVYSYLNEALKSLIDKISALQFFGQVDFSVACLDKMTEKSSFSLFFSSRHSLPYRGRKLNLE